MEDCRDGLHAIARKLAHCLPAAAADAPPFAADLTDHATLMAMPLTVVIFGATGDLAKKKLFPALYALCAHGHLPKTLDIVGYGRSAVDLAAFIQKQCANIKPVPGYPPSEFTARIRFHAGGYDAPASYAALGATMRTYEASHASSHASPHADSARSRSAGGNRLFFLSVPPSIFGAVARMIAEHCRAGGAAASGGFTRLMIEKPFGRDSESFDVLNRATASVFDENQLYRLDHYLGKEVLLRSTARSTAPFRSALHKPIPQPVPPPSLQTARPPPLFPRRIATWHRPWQLILNIPTLRWGNQLFIPLMTSLIPLMAGHP